MSSQNFAERIQEYKATIHQLPDVNDAARIQYTVKRLEGLHFVPTLILPIERFTSLSKVDILREIDRIANLSEQEIHASGVRINQEVQETKIEQIGLLVYHFTLLTRLRQDDPLAWDEIDELYGDD
ncbi:hypothetical protein U27_07064 [Candidatus Vecturithrix granuli]|uniref:Uncharacterized protein n=1 Tax=Vecturithrix granuli TaxID=1499967 RepID=A0A081C671_VECG1|nr:hypothetical protein U27_07064 [Candidatus Vecturithrix granuli]